ncbi:MAG: SDR family NAD(P)-dependent oxidoreductase [Candidatus Dormibacteraeota bacterium]|uniref:SDR family NAD(P)-dependent oxidoreductase n=1 Tax=Candidatus Aeolococcus gillhamiae TaxID=3127015 RepID=A0A2W6AWL1_9BACT|nr:SDR family NAD(P)-dependent oxidoreductase [Candidatus Dormibacteraeota bacterium]PZR82331.1 MAG: short-chain dehydrogenase/reductase [Candidatus Dormibacter sp. RRmetagenome_bin12]
MDDTAVVVSGASTGIGRATALHLDSLGLRVFAGVRRDEDAESLRRDGSNRLTPIRLDVTDAEQVAAAARQLSEAVQDSRLAGIVNNAGIAVAGPVEFVPLDLWRTQLEINVLGVVSMVQAFTPLLRESRGRIVTVGSLGGRLAQPMAAPYCASKHALEAISDALRLELRPWGIKVSLIQPGAVKTPIWDKGVRAGSELLRNAPPELRTLYGAAVDIASKMAIHENETGVEPTEVARAVEHALLSSRPRTRYPVGRQAKLLIPLSRLLPDRLKDELLLRVSGLPRTADATASSSAQRAESPAHA